MHSLKNQSITRYLLLPAFLLLPSVLYAANKISINEWKSLTQDKAFGYRNEKELVKTTSNPAAKNFFSAVIENIMQFFASPAGKIFIWTILIAAISYSLVRIIIHEKSFLFAKKEKPLNVPEDQSEADEAEDIATGDWEIRLKEALKEKNTKLAIRYAYMLLLQLLQKNELIQYRADKTNYDYYHELKSGILKNEFRQLSRQYEYAWYGDYPVAPAQFENYMKTFNQLKKQLHAS